MRLSSSTTKTLLAAAVLLMIVCVQLVAAAPYEIRPLTPIPKVPFRVTDVGATPPPDNTYVSISRWSNCNDTTTKASTSQKFNPNAATFTVDLPNTKLYLCLDATNTLLTTINLQGINLFPGWASPNTDTQVEITPKLPSGAILNFHQFPNCLGTTLASATIDYASQTATIPGFIGIYHPCAVFMDEVTSQSRSVPLSPFQTFTGLGFTPNVTVINKLETFYVSGVSNDGSNIRWARNVDCTNVVGEYTLSSWAITTTVNVPRGQYHFCWDSSGTGTGYISLGLMDVLKFSSLPRTIFVNSAVRFRLTDDSPWTTSFIVADVNCQNNVFGQQLGVDATGVQTTPVTFTATNQYYVCVAQTSDTSSLVRADQSTVVALYSVTFASPATVKRGVPATVTANNANSPVSSTFFAAPDSLCNVQYTNFTTSSYVGQLIMPTSGLGSTVNSFTLCAMTADGTSSAAIGTYAVQNYVLELNVPVQSISRSITLDGATPLPANFYLSTGNSCGPKSASIANYTAGALAMNIIYPLAGPTSICYESSSTITSKLDTVDVLPLASAAPTATFHNTQQTVTVSNVPKIGAVVMIIPTTYNGGACPAFPGTGAPFIHNSSASASPTYAVTVTFTALTTYMVCVSYENKISGRFFAKTTTITVVEATVTPRYYVDGGLSWSRIVIPASYGPVVVQKMYLSAMPNCNDATPTTYPTSINGTTMLSVTTGTGQRYACFHTSNMTVATDYGVAANVTVFPEAVVDFPTSQPWARTYNIPFNFIFPATWGYIPSNYFLSTDPNLCADVAASGTINTLTGQTNNMISLSQVSHHYSVCVSPPTTASSTYIRAGSLDISKFVAVSTTFIHGVIPVVNTAPALGSGKAYFLLGDSTCKSTTLTSYPLSLTTPLPATTTISNALYLCAYDAVLGVGAWVSPSSVPINVVAAFTATFPVPVIGEVPFTATISSNVLANAKQYAYLKAGHNVQCNAVNDTRLGGTFGGTSATMVSMTVPHRTNVSICALAADNTTAAHVGNVAPLPYANPSEIVKTDVGPVRIQLGDGSVPAGWIVHLTRDDGCTYPETGTHVVQAGGYIEVPLPSTFTTTNTNGQMFVCLRETAGGTARLMDWVYVWDTFGSTTITVINDGFPAYGGKYFPAQPISVSLPPNLHSAFLSHYTNCTGDGVVDSSTLMSYGAFPAEGENTTYYICAVTNRNTFIAAPAPLEFWGFDFIPQIAVTEITQTGYFFPPLARFTTTAGGIADPYGGVYWSRDGACAAGTMIAGPVYVNVSSFTIPGGDGMIYTCVYPGGGRAPVRVKSHMYYKRANTTLVSSNAIAGLPFCLRVNIPSPALWNQMEGVAPIVGPVTARRFFFATAGNRCSAASVVGNQVKLGSPAATFCLETDVLTSGVMYDLCGPTPNGAVPYVVSHQFNYLTTNNTNGFVYGTPFTVPVVMVPSLPSTSFGWAATKAGCTATRNIAPDFATDAFGVHVMDWRAATAFTGAVAFAEGTYWLCMRFDTFSAATSLRREAKSMAVVQGDYYAVGPTWIGRPHHYSVTSSSIVSLVPTTLQLHDDLEYSYLAGISTSSDCSPLDTTSASFSPVASGDVKQAIVQTNVAIEGSYYLCARGPVNGSIVPVQPMQTLYKSDFIHQNSESACQTFIVSYAKPTSPFAEAPGVVTLARGPCCPVGGVPAKDLLSTSSRVIGTPPIHSFYVTSQEITAMNGTSTFSLCYTATSATLGNVCLTAGTMNITTASCQTTLVPQPATTDANALPLAPNALLGASGVFTDDPVHDAAILGAILFFILLIILILCCLHCWRRGTVPPEQRELAKKNPARPDADDDGVEADDADSFALLFAANRTESAVNVGASPSNRSRGLTGDGSHVDFYAMTAGLPISTTLDMCHEPTNETLAAEAEERREREDIQLCENFLFEKMRRAYVTELRGMSALAVGSDRSRIIREGNNLLKEARERFCDIEEEHRAEIERQEQEEMYEIAVSDQEGYRRVSGHERDALAAVWQGEEQSWSARRERLLRSGHGRAIEAAEAAEYAAPHEDSQSQPMRHNVGQGHGSAIVSPTGASRARNISGFSPSGASDAPPPPPGIEPLMTSPAYPSQSRPRGGGNTSGTSSLRGSHDFQDPMGSLPTAPAPSPPPLAIRGDPLLHFTVPAPSNTIMNRGIPSPGHHSQRSGDNSGAATPFRDPLGAGTTGLPSPQRNPLHSPLSRNNNNNNNESLHHHNSRYGGNHPHMPVDNDNSYNFRGNYGNNNSNVAEDREEMRAYYPSHASRPAMAGASPGVRWGPGQQQQQQGGSPRRQQQDPSDFEVYRAPRR